MRINNSIKTSKKEIKEIKQRSEVAVSITSTQAKQLQNVMALACLWRLSLDMTAMKKTDLHVVMKDLFFGNTIKKYISQMVQLEKGMASYRLKCRLDINFLKLRRLMKINLFHRSLWDGENEKDQRIHASFGTTMGGLAMRALTVQNKNVLSQSSFGKSPKELDGKAIKKKQMIAY